MAMPGPKPRSAKSSPIRRKEAIDRRESLIKVLVTDDERQLFEAAAGRMGLSLSAWMRAVALSVSRAPENR